MYLRPIKFEDAVSDPWFRPADATCGWAQWKEMVREFAQGRYRAWRFHNGLEGLVIAKAEAGKLFVFYLTGRGFWGKREAVLDELRGISRSLGLSGVSGCCRDKTRVKFFAGAGMRHTTRKTHGEQFYTLECD